MSQLTTNAAILPLRTRLRAGDECDSLDTNCIAVQGDGSSLRLENGGETFNTCSNGYPTAGLDCNRMLRTLMNKPAGTSCQKC